MTIREARLKRGMTMRELAEKIGVTESAISHWEHGNKVPRFQKIGLIAKALNVPVNELEILTQSVKVCDMRTRKVRLKLGLTGRKKIK